jgi:hypothetical protein
MTHDEPSATVPAGPRTGSTTVYGHSVRDALMAVIDRDGWTTSTLAAAAIGESTGSCSFHLRRLESLGLIEPVPGTTGRIKPWRRVPAAEAIDADRLNRELEDVAYATWLDQRAALPAHERHELGFSDVYGLTPMQIRELGVEVRRLLRDIAGRPRGGTVVKVAVVVRAFPLAGDVSADDGEP